MKHNYWWKMYTINLNLKTLINDRVLNQNVQSSIKPYFFSKLYISKQIYRHEVLQLVVKLFIQRIWK